MKEINYKEIFSKKDPVIKRTLDLSFAISDILEKFRICNGYTKRDLAKLFNKNESEIAKWLSGTQNFTVRTIAKIENVIGENILLINPKPHDIESKIVSSSNNEMFLQIHVKAIGENITMTNDSKETSGEDSLAGVVEEVNFILTDL